MGAKLAAQDPRPVRGDSPGRGIVVRDTESFANAHLRQGGVAPPHPSGAVENEITRRSPRRALHK